MTLKRKLEYGNTTINYSIIKTRRRKTSEIIVNKDVVEIRAPFDKPEREIRNLIQDKANWILKKQKEYSEMNPEIVKPIFGENSTLPYLGKNYPLKIFRTETRDTINFTDGQFIVYIQPSKSVTTEHVEELYEHWLMKAARRIFVNKVKSYSEKLGIEKPERVSIKKLKNRWGSLGKKGDVVNLNVNLMKASENIIDYVVLHELCHLKVKEHSHHYWGLLHKFIPDYQERIQWLITNGTNLL